MIIINIDHF